MTLKKYSEFRVGQGNNTLRTGMIVPFELAGLTYQGSLDEMTGGLSVKRIYSMADFPAPVSGVIQLEQDTMYLLCNVGSPVIDAPPVLVTPNKFLIPAGWNGTIRSSHTPRNGILYLGADALLNTLNIDGSILSIADSGANPGTHSTITTGAPHGLLDGQYVNITGTTDVNYSQQRLLISNVTASTFDVEIPFVLTDTGLFDTGAFGVLNWEVPFYSTGAGNLYDISFTPDPTGLFNFEKLLAFNFKSLGIVRKAPFVVGNNAITTFLEDGLTFEDCDTIQMDSSVLTNVNPANTTAKCLIITGALTRDVIIDGTKLNTAHADQRPVRIDGSVNNADSITIKSSPDNNVSDDYFDISAGGLDQTDPSVLTKNNGSRANSMSSAQVGFTNIAIPIVVTIVTQDVPVVIGGSQFTADNVERASTTAAGQITNLTKVTRKYPITFSALIEKVGGGSTDIGLLLIKNGSLVLTNTFEIPHSVNPGIIQISATRDFELAENDTIELAVVNFSGTADISVSQANIVYSVEA